jgi:multimeric flavodoxin WrbA
MLVVAIGGSPRKGNTEWLLTQLAEELQQQGVEVELLLLRRLHIKSCTGCLKCEDRRGRCVLTDDMDKIYPRLLAADAIVLASPVYLEMISGLMKTFIDRTCPVWTQLAGKRLAGLVAAEEGVGQAMRNLRQYGRVCRMQWVGGISVLAKHPQDAQNNRVLASKLRRLACGLLG